MRKFAIVMGCLLYVISPLDLVPDLIVGLGQLDDLVAIVLTVRALLNNDVPQPETKEGVHPEQAGSAAEGGSPR